LEKKKKKNEWDLRKSKIILSYKNQIFASASLPVCLHVNKVANFAPVSNMQIVG
jgi:hypothetical protein